MRVAGVLEALARLPFLIRLAHVFDAVPETPVVADLGQLLDDFQAAGSGVDNNFIVYLDQGSAAQGNSARSATISKGRGRDVF